MFWMKIESFLVILCGLRGVFGHQLDLKNANFTGQIGELTQVLNEGGNFGGLPWTLEVAWRMAQNNLNLRGQRLNGTQLAVTFCSLVFDGTKPSDVDGCWVHNEADEKYQRTLYTLRFSPNSVRVDEEVIWLYDNDNEIGPKSDEKTPLSHFWTLSVPGVSTSQLNVNMGSLMSIGLVVQEKLMFGGGAYRLAVRIPISALKIDPCTRSKDDFFLGHSCDTFSTKCISSGFGSVLNASHSCECSQWFVPLHSGSFDPNDQEFFEFSTSDNPVDGQRVCVRGDLFTQNVLLILQLVFIGFGLLIGLVTFSQRKTKVLTNSMWPITEVIVVGSILIYSTVLLRSIEQPNTTICILEPWVRELGFALAYGAIVLKIYRALVEFRTRKAHRWVVREKDIIRYLCAIFSVVIFYMSAWTVMGHEFGKNLTICPITWWHRTTELGEIIFLGVGLHMAYHLRNAQSPWNERRFYTTALCLEGLVSIVLVILRECRGYMDGGNEFLFLLSLYFARTQATITIVLLLVFVPKFYYVHDERAKRLARRDGGTRKALDAINGVGDLDLAEINLADMDPSDIRTELKRVYTQLEMLRNKQLRKDNPHISKRRGGRKPTHRRFSLQALHRKNQRSFRYHDDNEDSICSIEASTYSEACR